LINHQSDTGFFRKDSKLIFLAEFQKMIIFVRSFCSKISSLLLPFEV
jgi:hypothetical protein